MADVKISALPVVTALASTDVAPFVHGGLTVKATVAQVIAAAPAFSLAAESINIDGAHAADVLEGKNELVIYDGSNNVKITLDQLYAWIRAQG